MTVNSKKSVYLTGGTFSDSKLHQLCFEMELQISRMLDSSGLLGGFAIRMDLQGVAEHLKNSLSSFARINPMDLEKVAQLFWTIVFYEFRKAYSDKADLRASLNKDHAVMSEALRLSDPSRFFKAPIDYDFVRSIWPAAKQRGTLNYKEYTLRMFDLGGTSAHSRPQCGI